jgi:hypothetical protein
MMAGDVGADAELMAAPDAREVVLDLVGAVVDHGADRTAARERETVGDADDHHAWLIRVDRNTERRAVEELVRRIVRARSRLDVRGAYRVDGVGAEHLGVADRRRLRALAALRAEDVPDRQDVVRALERRRAILDVIEIPTEERVVRVELIVEPHDAWPLLSSSGTP